jgi:hypothetical protein
MLAVIKNFANEISIENLGDELSDVGFDYQQNQKIFLFF